MKCVETPRRTSGRLLSGSVALLALLVTSCTSTGTGTGTPSMQLAANADGSMIADTLQSAADQTRATENSAAAPTDKAASYKAAAEKANETKTDKNIVAEAQKQPATETAQAVNATAAQEQPVQVAALAPQQAKRTSLFGSFGGKTDQAEPDAATASTTKAQPAAEAATTDKTQAAPAETAQTEAAKPAESEKPTQVTSLFGSAKTANPPATANAFASPQRPASAQTASQGSISRLFSDPASKGVEGRKVAVIKPVTSASSDYNYSLPGVRANAGFEIKHRKSIDDDSDIDANEDDEFATIQLASAPGLARLAPNGLKVQRETVDVACLKPELVRTLKTMERHFRRPVMVTSGYRSPSYNRKVNGARRSLHMICAAADIQIDGVSKWEIARYARSMPGRGGVGTYCHTTSVHVDVGPERDWNWRCKG